MKKCNLFLRAAFAFHLRKDHKTTTPILSLKRNMSSLNTEKPVYEVNFRTCEDLYLKWEKEGKYRKLPTGGLDFKVSYVDTRKSVSSSQETSVPTVLALHGAPGSYEDYSGLTAYLHQKGMRVVVPNFPDFSVYNPGIFRHSAEEKAQFIKDFLKALSIQQIDSLIVHSSAIYPGLLLCLENNPSIKSLIMLNPGTHNKHDMLSTENLKFMKWMVFMSEVPILYKVLQIFGPSLLRIIRIPVRVDNFLDPLLSTTVMVRGDISETKEKFLQLSKNGLPMLYAFSNDDKLIGKVASYSLAQLLGCSDSDIFIYDKNGELKQNGKETSTLKVISFENGSHYVFWKQADIINREISNFMAKL